MRILFVEDDFPNRWIIQKHLAPYGDIDIAVNGEEAIESFNLAWREGKPYDLICLDIMIPKKDGQQVLQEIREKEKEQNVPPSEEVKIIMVTVLEDPENVFKAYYKGKATSYILKPVDKEKLVNELKKLKLIE